MATLKCKMCGGDLQIAEGMTVAECEYCGTRQTVPNVDNEKKLTLFGRANRLRMACEFDKAAGVYESIVAEFPEEAEAYWGLVLCRYGIEYVDDPATGKKIPTCHRSSFESVMEDSDFEQACENADAVARRVYREEAKAIEDIRRGIIEVSGKEAPYDIFICYKETDENGDRTIDSVIAQDVYNALSEKGYRVFFSRITLEDKLGQEYEPYIFAALHSAKVMLAFGTDYEYYNAVWVKNEWSRFLQLIAAGEKKMLIPCYKGIDAYDMPKEFTRLQAQDMGKVGAIQDLLRGIEKIIPSQNSTVKEPVAQQNENPGVTPLLKRAFIFLEDGNWENAEVYCEKVLDLDPENAMAYVGKLMASIHVRQMEQLSETDGRYEEMDNYQKALRFGDDALKRTLRGYIETIRDRETENQYVAAVKEIKTANTVGAYMMASRHLQTIAQYRDAGALAEQCRVQAKELKKKNDYEVAKKNREDALTAGMLLNAAAQFDALDDYNDSKEQADQCRKESATIRESAYRAWTEYQPARERIDSIQERLDVICSEQESLEKELETQKQARQKLLTFLSRKKSHQEAILNLQEQQSLLEKERNGLGMLAFSKKKELSERIDILFQHIAEKRNSIEVLNKQIAESPNEADLLKKIAELENRIDKCASVRSVLNAEKQNVLQEAKESAERLQDRKIIANLAADPEVILNLIEVETVLRTIKTDAELSRLIKDMDSAALIPSDVKKLLWGKSDGLDASAIYFQACQALENPNTLDDLRWAKEQFQTIIVYKDARIKVAICEEKLNNFAPTKV